MSKRLFQLIPGLENEEFLYLKEITKDLTDNQVETFASIYSGKRKKSETILIATIIGFFGFAGIQRFLLDQIGMGLLYFFTCGLCFIGTIVDLVNYKSLASEYNQKAANEALLITRSIITG